jgi:hypothetical protein
MEDQTGRAQKWINAENYCHGLNLNGDGWRLPTIDELNSIVDTNYKNPALNPIFKNGPGLGTWSGTTYADNNTQAWGIGFYSGGWHHCNKDGRIKLIRCVRTDTETPVNNIPVAVAGADQNIVEGDSVTLDGSDSSDTDGSIVSYIWKENEIILSRSISFDKTDFTVGTHIITLTVTDNDGATASDDVTITIQSKPPVPGNTLPTANAGKDRSVVLGESVTIVGSGEDTDGTIASYVWTKDATVVATTASFEYTPVEAGTDTFTLTVTDDDGATASDIMNVLVTETAPPPPSEEEFSSDDFSSDTLSDYTTGGSGSWSYDNANEQVNVSSSGRTGFSFSHALSPSEEGTFSFTVSPLQKNSSTGLIELRLEENANTYYRIVNRDGDITGGITKYVNGTRVDAKWFRKGFSQGKDYTVTVTFDHGSATVSAFGQTLTINKNQTSIDVNAFTIRTVDQNANFDTIVYHH